MKSHFKFNKQERSGIFFLLLIIVVLQGVFFFVKNNPVHKTSRVTHNTAMQSSLDSLKNLTAVVDDTKVFPFNPNFISDYKGYTLGMSPEELNLLFAFRKKGKFINSAEDFQRVTGVSDSLLNMISPHFRYPEWTNRKPTTNYTSDSNTRSLNGRTMILDLNAATAEALKSIYGVGDKLSARIVKFRDRLGGFVVNDQLNDVYGLKSEVVERILEQFQVQNPPKVKKIDINKASVEELNGLIYFNYGIAQKIVGHREEIGPIQSLYELADITGFPPQKIDRIGLYLLMTND